MLIDLTDQDAFARNDFWAMFEWLRANDPVHWHTRHGGDGFWAITKHADAVAVYRDSDTFSSRYGMRLVSNPEAVSAVTQQMLIVSDPPEHTQLKRVLAKPLRAEEMTALEATVREIVREQLADAVRAGELDFLEAVWRIPTRVGCALLGVPRADWDWLGQTVNRAFEGETDADQAGSHAEIFLYFSELLAERRRDPGDDFISRIASDSRETENDGERRPLTDEEIVINLNGVMSGANETTRFTAAGGLLGFVQHPDQWATLRAEGTAVIPTAVEEMLRWASPALHVLRTAMRPTTVGGKEISVGDRLVIWNVSANRDESAFPHANRFDITRMSNQHLTFGSGRHLCIGARLARLELAIFLEELIEQVAAVELTGDPEYIRSNFTWGLRRLPVRLTPTAARVTVLS